MFASHGQVRDGHSPWTVSGWETISQWQASRGGSVRTKQEELLLSVMSEKHGITTALSMVEAIWIIDHERG